MDELPQLSTNTFIYVFIDFYGYEIKRRFAQINADF